MDIKGTDIGRLWSTHFPRRKIDAASRMFCLSIGHAIRNIAQNIPLRGPDGTVAKRIEMSSGTGGGIFSIH
jgi:hypothetical protein